MLFRSWHLLCFPVTIGVVVDGIVGQNTILAVNMENPKELFDKIKADRLRYIDYICEKRQKNLKYRKGWINRVNAIGYEE